MCENKIHEKKKKKKRKSFKVPTMPLHKHHVGWWGVRCFPDIANQWKHMTKAILYLVFNTVYYSQYLLIFIIFFIFYF